MKVKARLKGVSKSGKLKKPADFEKAKSWAISAVRQLKAADNLIGFCFLAMISICSHRVSTYCTMVGWNRVTDALEKNSLNVARRIL